MTAYRKTRTEKPRSKKRTEEQAPAPYITPAEWLKESIDFANKIKAELGLIKWARDRHNAGEMPDHSFDESVHDHLDNIEAHAVDLVLSLDRATVGACDAEDAIATALEDLRVMWWRLKKLSA